MSKYARRQDANHGQLRTELEGHGWLVSDVHDVPNYFDLIIARRGVVVFVEVKDGAKAPSRRKLRPNQVELHATFQRAGAITAVLTSVGDVEQLGKR
jgi:hypothetical protein